MTIAHRKVIDLVRKAHRAAKPVAEVPVEPTEFDHDDSEIDLAPLLGRLPDRQRLAVVYHYLGGLPYAEVAGRDRWEPGGGAASRGRRDRQAPKGPGHRRHRARD